MSPTAPGISATFSAAITPSTVTASSFTLKSTASVTGTPSASGAVAQFAPAQELDLGTTFTASLGTGISSTSGAHLSSTFSWTFTTKHYGGEVQISTGSAPGTSPQVAVDAAGNAIAVWVDSQYAIWQNRYRRTQHAWVGATRIDAGDATNGTAPRIAMDQNGDALVVWSQNVASNTMLDVYSARFTASTQMWSPAALAEKITLGDSTSPVIAGDGMGHAIVLWNQKDATTGIYTLWTNSYGPAGWATSSQQVETSHVGNAATYDIVLDVTGNATAIWTGATPSVSQFPAGGTKWGSITQLHNITGAQEPHLAGASNGILTATWTETSGTGYAAWGDRFVSGAWLGATSIQSTSTASASQPTLATDSQGNAIAMWVSYGGTTGVFSNTYLASGGWQGEQTMGGTQPVIAISPNGHAAAAWVSGSPVKAATGPIDAKGATGWTALPVQLTALPGERPQVGINDNGDGFAVWGESDGTIWANRFR